jgi:5'-3' exonuclease
VIVLVDADSLIWSSCYRQKEHPDDEQYHTIENAKLKFDEVFMSIVNTIEEIHEVDRVLTFAGARGNFRKEISRSYKANRVGREIPPILNELQEHVKETYNSIAGCGVETDDVVATYWKNLTDTFGRDEVIIVSIDKDYKQLPCIIYNYHLSHQCYYDITKEQSLYNFYEQMIIGDTSDNVNFCKGYGVKYVHKAFKDCLSEQSYIRVVFQLFKKIYKHKAREKFIECKLLLKLKTNE